MTSDVKRRKVGPFDLPPEHPRSRISRSKTCAFQTSAASRSSTYALYGSSLLSCDGCGRQAAPFPGFSRYFH